MNQVYNELISLVPSIVIAIITAVLTVKLSLKQFYSQKWWEKKIEVYTKIIESLAIMQHYMGLWFDELIGLNSINEETNQKFAIDYHKHRHYIIEVSNQGAFIISNEVAIELEKLIKELNQDEQDLIADYGDKYSALKKSIEKIRNMAKKDLMIRNK